MRQNLRHPSLIVSFAAAAVMLGAAPSAHANGWTHTRSFDAGREKFPEPVPRSAIASDGSSAFAWKSASGRLMLSTGRRRGRFTKPRQIDRRGASDWSVAARRGGGFVVAWEDRDGVRVAVRTRRGRHIAVRRVVSGSGESINGVQVAADPRGGWVLADREFRRTSGHRAYHVRAMTLSAGGRLSGAVQDLGRGQFGIDARQTQALAVDGRGRAVLTFEGESGSSALTLVQPIAASVRPHGGRFAEPVTLGGDPSAEPRVAVDGDGHALITATQVRSGGDAGAFGNPIVAGVSPAATLGMPVGPELEHPRRAFGPTAAFRNGGRSVLVFALKPAPKPFDRRGTVRAVAITAAGRVGRLQTLTSRQAAEPVVMALTRGRSLAMWSGKRGIGASVAGSNGQFRKTRGPSGPAPSPFHGNATNRDLHTAGHYAIFTWSRREVVRVTVRRF